MTILSKLNDIGYFGNRVATLGRIAIVASALTLALCPFPKYDRDKTYQYYANRFDYEIKDPESGKTYSPKIKTIHESLEVLIESSKNAAPLLLSISAFTSGLLGIALTLNGRTTKKYYKKTKKHIELRGELAPEFIEKVIKKSENSKVLGYCELQGIYLAARDTDNLDVFYQVKNKLSRNIIPNF